MQDGHLLPDEESKRINSAQAEWYKNGELELIEKYLDYYKNLIVEMQNKKQVTILDVGGGAGYFLKELAARLPDDMELEIYLLDTYKYDTWDDEKTDIHFILGDALTINQIFAEKKFDYVFCNAVFHHFLGKSFRESSKIRERILKNIIYVLKDDGKIGIIEHYSDGLFMDSISCRIIYALTTVKNPLMVKICKRFGSNSAGVGVCMLSRKMWYRLIEKNRLRIVEEIEATPEKFGLPKKICLLNKSYREYNLMICAKQIFTS